MKHIFLLLDAIDTAALLTRFDKFMTKNNFLWQ